MDEDIIARMFFTVAVFAIMMLVLLFVVVLFAAFGWLTLPILAGVFFIGRFIYVWTEDWV